MVELIHDSSNAILILMVDWENTIAHPNGFHDIPGDPRFQKSKQID
jgi:hypothetical protein